MSSSKRPGGSFSVPPSKSTSASSSKRGMDSLLLSKGRGLKIGEEVRFTLIKGPSLITSDPVNDRAPSEQFPAVAKFPESVIAPDFQQWKRFYQQDIPSQKDDSDEEAELEQQSLEQKKKKRRWRRKGDGPRRQWVLQEEEDYLETMIAQREMGKNYKQNTSSISTRYEGIPEHNPSHYIIIRTKATANGEGGGENTNINFSNGHGNNSSSSSRMMVSMLPTPHAVHAFSQPAKVQTLSMTEAEQAIEDQRSRMTRYMMHNRRVGAEAPPANSKSRLLGKLKSLAAKTTQLSGNNDEDDDDIMGDIKFASRKGSSSRARKELLGSLADGVAIDADGVMGGTNDREFGGKRRFAHLNVTMKEKAKAATEEPATKSNDGMAMSDDFYQRDVKAEYEELDYDANEQFDDDDVDHGEADVNFEGGFEYEEDEEDEDDDEEGDDDEKKEGLASVRGLKDMLARARGEAPAEAKDGNDTDDKGPGSRPTSPATSGVDDDNNNNNNSSSNNGEKMATATSETGKETGLANVMAAAERHRENASRQKAPKPVEKPTGVQVDELGQRIVTLESVRYEIFLHNKVIQTKKLMKIFSIKKKSAPERIRKFQGIIKELCNMVKDPVHGNMLKLKQHYSK